MVWSQRRIRAFKIWSFGLITISAHKIWMKSKWNTVWKNPIKELPHYLLCFDLRVSWLHGTAPFELFWELKTGLAQSLWEIFKRSIQTNGSFFRDAEQIVPLCSIPWLHQFYYTVWSTCGTWSQEQPQNRSSGMSRTSAGGTLPCQNGNNEAQVAFGSTGARGLRVESQKSFKKVTEEKLFYTMWPVAPPAWQGGSHDFTIGADFCSTPLQLCEMV